MLLTENEASRLSALGKPVGKHCSLSQHDARSAALSYPPISRACNQAQIVLSCATALGPAAIADYREATGTAVLVTRMVSHSGQNHCCQFPDSSGERSISDTVPHVAAGVWHLIAAKRKNLSVEHQSTPLLKLLTQTLSSAIK